MAAASGTPGRWPAAILANRYRNAREQANKAQARAVALRRFAEEEYPRGPVQLDIELAQADAAVATFRDELTALDNAQHTSERALSDLRARLVATAEAAKNARIRVRDRRSLIARLDALRGQYADDQRKLNFLLDAERLFDPLHVVTCPVCFNDLVPPPTVENGTCSLCHNPVPTRPVADGTDDAANVEDPAAEAEESDNVQMETGAADSNSPAAEDAAQVDVVDDGGDTAALADATAVLASEVRNITKRLRSLNDYATRLHTHQRVLEEDKEAADAAANAAAAAVDAIATSPAPWLAQRDSVTQRITDAQIAAQAAQAGGKLWNRVAEADASHERLDVKAKAIFSQRKAQRARPDRNAVINALSHRFGEVLAAIGYPKLSNPYIADDLVPYVRNHVYTEASSGGMVVIGLAWNLALWEVAHERDADAPGLLVIDSPQKNLGYNSKPGDQEFADAQLVENFYAHAKNWLATEGTGAQLIVVDNSPPDSVEDDVVIRFTRDPEVPPYGLIPEATS